MWTSYRVSWLFLTKLCGSVPKNKDLVTTWLEARKPSARPPGGKSIDEIQEEVFDTIAVGEPEQEPIGVGFQVENGRLVQRAATIKAHLKDCARVLSAQYIGKLEGERSFSTRVINGLYPDPHEYWIPILRPDGTPVIAPDGTHEKPVHVRSRTGEALNSLKLFEYVEPARLDFTLLVLTAMSKQHDKHQPKPSITKDDLINKLFKYGGIHGYAGERSDGEGKYTLLSLEEIATDE